MPSLTTVAGFKMRYVMCVIVLSVVASHVLTRESSDIARRIQERDEEYRQQLLAEQEALLWPE